MKIEIVKTWEEITPSLNAGADIVVLTSEEFWGKCWVIICRHEFTNYVETSLNNDFYMVRGLSYGPQEFPRFIIITHDQSPGEIMEKMLQIMEQFSGQLLQTLSKKENNPNEYP